MKALSKAAKRRGRKLRADVKRGSTGRIARQDQKTPEQLAREQAALEARLAVETATWKRRQENPALSVEEARKPHVAIVLDRWLKRSDELRRQDRHEDAFVTAEQVGAAKRFAELTERYKAVIGARAQRSASDFDRVGGYDNTDPFDGRQAARDRATEQDYQLARRAVLESGPFSMFAFEAIVIENRELPRSVGDLRLACNALVRLWNNQKAA